MLDNFKTKDVLFICDKYNNAHPVYLSIADTYKLAEALLRAYKDSAIQPDVETEAKYRCFFCSTPTQPTEKGQACPICGGRPA